MQLGQIFEVTIDKVNHQCEGLVRLDGIVTFVPFVLPGEKIQIEIAFVQKKYARAKVLKILEPSQHRVKPACDYFYRCGGCQIQQVTYAQQIQMKSQLLQEQLQTLNAQFEYRDFVSSPRELSYRYRSFIPVSIQKSKMLAGYYAPESHDIVDIENCPQLEPGLNTLYLKIRQFIADGNLGPIPLRHILILSSYPAGWYQLVLVWFENEFPAKRDLILKLKKTFLEISIGFNYQTQATNVIVGRHWEWLQGEPELINRFGDIEFRSSLKAFSQVNPAIAEKIYKTIQNEIQPQKILVDLYGGSGVLSKMLSEQFESVTVVEENPHSIALGQKHFGLGKFVNATVEKYLAGQKTPAQDSTFIINPPRKGCSDETIEHLLRIKPANLFYISCNPASLVRDLKKLREVYEIQWVQGFDMFPQTHHFETLVKLRQNKAI